MKLLTNTTTVSIPKEGNEVCGDTIITHRCADRSLVLVSDGLGSGITASLSS